MPKFSAESPQYHEYRPLKPASLATTVERRIRVMIVDDAIVARRLLARWIDAEPDMTVVACLRTGREAVDQIEAA